MFCDQCGQEIDNNSRFCEFCGAEVVNPFTGNNQTRYQDPNQTQFINNNQTQYQGQNQNLYVIQNQQNTKKTQKSGGAGKTILLVGIVVILLAALGGVGFFFLYLRQNASLDEKRDEYAQRIVNAGIHQYITEKDELLQEWDDLGIFSKGDKEDILDQLENSAQVAEDYMKNLPKRRDEYVTVIDQIGEETYLSRKDDLIQEWDAAGLYDKNKDEEILTGLENVMNEAKAHVAGQVEFYKSINMESAAEEEKNAYKASVESLNSLYAEEKYTEMKAVMADLDRITEMYVQPENSLNISAQQVDVMEFPVVRLYMNIQNAADGSVPQNLEPAKFYLNKKDASENYVPRVVRSVSMLEDGRYLVEYEAEASEEMVDQIDAVVGYHSRHYAGEGAVSYKLPVIAMDPANGKRLYRNGPGAAVESFMINFPNAVSRSDFSLISPYIKQGSPVWVEQEGYVRNNIQEILTEYEITDVSYLDANTAHVSTKETYDYQMAGKSWQHMTQAVTYRVVNVDNQWKITDFDDFAVLSRS